MNKNIILILILFISNNTFSQSIKDTIYLDYQMQAITKYEYTSLSRHHLYQKSKIVNDSVIINKLEYNYEFSKLSNEELTQVKHLLKKQFNVDSSNKTILFTYSDTIYGVNEFITKREARRIYDQLNFNTKKKYLLKRKEYDRRQKRCKKYAKKHNIIPIYSYSFNNNFSYNTEHHKKQKISKSLANIFFKNKRLGYVILKPNGYLFYYRYLTQYYLDKILNEDWDTYINDYKSAISTKKTGNIQFYLDMIDQRNRERNFIAKQKIKEMTIAERKKRNKIVIKPEKSCFCINNF